MTSLIAFPIDSETEMKAMAGRRLGLRPTSSLFEARRHKPFAPSSGSGVDPSASQKTDNFLDKTAVVPYLFSHVLEERAGWPVPKPFRLAPLATGRRGAPEHRRGGGAGKRNLFNGYPLHTRSTAGRGGLPPTIDLYGAGQMATACWASLWKRSPLACERRRLNRKVNSSR